MGGNVLPLHTIWGAVVEGGGGRRREVTGGDGRGRAVKGGEEREKRGWGRGHHQAPQPLQVVPVVEAVAAGLRSVAPGTPHLLRACAGGAWAKLANESE